MSGEQKPRPAKPSRYDFGMKHVLICSTEVKRKQLGHGKQEHNC